ncbi:hypothetical protein ACFL0V_03795 [Nanoarchaeota archaeon]
MMVLLLSMLLLSLLCVPIVLGMGVGPSRKFISFTPGETIEGELFVTNQEKASFWLGVYPEGDLSEYVEVEEQLILVDNNDVMVRIPYKIKLPQSAKPGDNTIELVLRQFPIDKDIEGTTISASIAVIAEVIIRVPYPGKYAEGKMFISDAEDMDKPTLFTVMVYNYGTEHIGEAKAHIDFYSPTGDKVGEADSYPRAVSPKEEVRIDAAWEKQVEMGTYRAVAKVGYDNKEFQIEKVFDVGKFTIELSDVQVSQFKLGDVARFSMSVFNNWNKKIDGVWMDVIITDEDGKEMTRFKTPAIDIPSEEMGEFEGYWYTAGVMPGYYNIKFIIHYGKKTTQKEMQMKVDYNKIEFVGMETGYVTAEAPESVKTENLLLILIIAVVVLLIVMNMVWFYFLSKRMRGKNE